MWLLTQIHTSDFPRVYCISFLFVFITESHLGYHITFCHHDHVSLCHFFFLLWQFLGLALFLWSWQFGQYWSEVFLECPSIGICLLLFWWLCCHVLGSKTASMRCHSHHCTSRVHTTNLTYHCWVSCDLVTAAEFVRFLHCKVTLLLLFQTVLFGKRVLCEAHT